MRSTAATRLDTPLLGSIPTTFLSCCLLPTELAAKPDVKWMCGQRGCKRVKGISTQMLLTPSVDTVTRQHAVFPRKAMTHGRL